MQRLIASALAVIPLLFATAALACPPDPDSYSDNDEDCDDPGLGLQVTVAMMAGEYGVSGVHDGAFGVALQAGHRWGDWMAYGEYDALGLGGDDLRDGMLHRAGAGLRYDALDFGSPLSSKVWAGGVLWLEAGVGLERSTWAGGTKVDRSDLALGVGGEYRIKFGGRKPRMVAVFYEARFLFADAPAGPTVAALCAEGCAGAPLDDRDLGVFFVGGLTFAR